MLMLLLQSAVRLPSCCSVRSRQLWQTECETELRDASHSLAGKWTSQGTTDLLGHNSNRSDSWLSDAVQQTAGKADRHLCLYTSRSPHAGHRTRCCPNLPTNTLKEQPGCKAAFLECAQQLDNMRVHLSRQSSADAEAAGAAALEVELPEPDLRHLPSYARPTR